MKLILLPPKKSLSKVFLRQRSLKSEIYKFKNNLSKLLGKIDEIEREENQKNHIRDFLLNTYYKDNYEVNTKGVKDLVIHTGKTNKSNVGVIIEAKRPGNKSEMISKDKLNCKAFQELVLYYLHERIDEKNIDIKYCVVTNIYEWFIFDAFYFEKYFYSNKKFVKQYEEWREGQKVTGDTNLFYNDIARPYIDSIEEEIPATYFDLREYVIDPEKPDEEKDKNLIALYKLLSPFHLLRIPFSDDSNKLDEKFYKELLYIIGLEEVKEGSKHIIRRKEKDNRNAGSLIENAISKLSILDSSDRVSDAVNYGDTKDEKNFNIALELCLTWINRILFLKLLEAQLIIYHKFDNSVNYKFLNPGKLKDFDELFSLFHHVLAVPEKERDADVKDKFKYVPYLNSTLFEISPLERETIDISNLNDSLSLEIIKNSILDDGKTKIKSMTSLEYILKFLDAYDFSSEGMEEIQEENRTLINASVLGKVFEKINGYKDGSIFTPGFITMYMCREAIRLAVTQKFKDKYNWTVDNFDDIKNFIADRRSRNDIVEFNEVIDSIKICDPAVGSGHFLVSSLNEMIAIKSELGIFADEYGTRITDYDITIEQDELIITDRKGDIFQYEVTSTFSGNELRVRPESQKLQRTLFHEKQKLIENCLFGVDINPNSVKICMLRLWIELLKNAYYKEPSDSTHSIHSKHSMNLELETLPNIDINIKTGNSLISRFPLDANLSKFGQKEKNIIEQYRNSVRDYKNERNRNKKNELTEIIRTLKNDIRTDISKKDPKLVKLNNIKSELDNLENQTGLFEQSKKEQKEQTAKKKKLEAELAKLTKEVDDIRSNAIYRNAFEWRFEFPEVLNSEGEYEGFDVVIGNPPYVNAMSLKKSLSEDAFKELKSAYETAKGTVDLYIYFFELGYKILKPNSLLSYITPNRYLSAGYGETLRRFIYDKSTLINLVDYSTVKVFEEVSIYPVVTLLKNIIQSKYTFVVGKYDNVSEQIIAKKINSDKLNFLEGFIWGYLLNDKIQLTEKIIKQSVSIVNAAIINATSTASEAELYHSLINESNGFRLINTGTIDRYENLWGKITLTDKGEKYLKPYLPKDSAEISSNRRNLYGSSKIILAKIALPTEAYYDEKGEYASINTNCLHTFSSKYNPKYVLSWLNSKLFQFIFECFFDGLRMAGGYLLYSAPNISKMYIKEITLDDQKPFVSLVDEILESKKQEKDTTALEDEIDRMVYKLYGLTEEEIRIVEGKENS